MKNKKERAIELAEKIKVLFSFCGDLIKDKDLLKETLNLCEEKQSMAVSAAPILGAFGQDYQDVEHEARIRKERSEALYNLVDVLDKTEKERIDYVVKSKKKKAGLQQLHKALGL